MLWITIPERPESEVYVEATNEFVKIPGMKAYKLQLEHSLVSISKWESKWCKPFLSKTEMTTEETIDYIKCMTLTQNVPDEVYNNITQEVIEQISKYIDSPMTATTFSNHNNGRASNEVITSELIYYWMIAQNIPVKFEKWHLNRLLTLIRVCSLKNAPPKKMGKQELASRNRALNEARRKQLNSRG